MVPAEVSGDPEKVKSDPVKVRAVMPLPEAVPALAERTRPKPSTTTVASG